MSISTSSPRIRPLSYNHGILFFDGVCTLCNGFVNFIIDHDTRGYFKIGALQQDTARSFLDSAGYDPDALDSLVLVEKGRVYRQSDAALRVVQQLDGAWPLLAVFAVLPRSIRDAIYRWVAANRYRWFGKRAQCRVPTPDLESRFLDPSPTAPSSSASQ